MSELVEMFEAAGGADKPRVGHLACGPDVSEHVEKIKPFVDAGFTEIALVQIGGAQQAEFIRWAEQELLPALRGL
jgi:hypothetical protein